MATLYNELMVLTCQNEIGYTQHSDGWTKYGQWYADNIAHNQSFAYADWCAMFITWCANQTGLTTVFPMTSPQGSEVNYMCNWFINQGCRTGGNDVPKIGDLVFYAWDGDASDLDHVGIVQSVQGSTADTAIMNVIEGNKSGACGVRQIAYRNYQVAITIRPKYEDEVKKNFPSLSFLLKKGDSGSAVEILQANLIYNGYSITGGVDGVFGQYTKDALLCFQENNDLIVDGKAGTQTFGAFADRGLILK